MRRILSLFTLLFAASTAATAVHAQAMKPGLWEITMQTTAAGMPAMPAMPKLSPAERKQMEAMGIKLPDMAGGPMHVSVKSCVTKEQAEKRLPPQTDEDRRQRCEQKDVKVSGNTTRWKIECSGEQKMKGSGSITQISPEAYSGESTMTVEDKQRGPMTMKQNFAGKWLAAACK